MAQFWLVSGNYTNSHFYEALAPNESWSGPFEDYQSARREWTRCTRRTGDDGGVRYRIECIDPEVPPHCTD